MAFKSPYFDPEIQTEKPTPRGANLLHSGDGLFHERPASCDTRLLLVWDWRLRGGALRSSIPPLFQPIGIFAQVGQIDTPVWISVLNRPLISQRRFHVPFECAGGSTDHAMWKSGGNGSFLCITVNWFHNLPTGYSQAECGPGGFHSNFNSFVRLHKTVSRATAQGRMWTRTTINLV